MPSCEAKQEPSELRSHPSDHPNPFLMGDRLFLSYYWLLFLFTKMVLSLISTLSVILKDLPTLFETRASPGVTFSNVLVPARVLRRT